MGSTLPPADYLVELRKISDEFGLLLMLDEVQTGIGRTGHWFAFQHTGIMPDVMTLAKGLGSGVPIGACLARGAAAEVFKPGNHGSTFGGNPLACTAALATLEAIEKEDLRNNALRIGQRIVDGLRAGLAAVPGVVEIRGQGLLIGVELDRPCGELVAQARDRGFLMNVTADNVVRLLPPLILKEAQADEMVAVLADLIPAFLRQAA